MHLNHGFQLYTVELHSDNVELLLGAHRSFAENAEITYFDRKSGAIELQFVSTANEDQILFICDEFKKEIESDGYTRLTYKVQITGL